MANISLGFAIFFFGMGIASLSFFQKSDNKNSELTQILCAIALFAGSGYEMAIAF